MFKKIQKYLLINYPLLWNTKIVPAITFTILFHILFFIIGYFNGIIDFTNENYYDYGFTSGVIIFFSILVTILFFVLWFVYYFRNNAYKSFYNLKKTSLYKEWLIILLISFLNVTYSVSYITGKTLRQRSYYSQEETQKRCETISMASVFIAGAYEPNYEQIEANNTGQITYNKKTYPQNSLINKSVESFNFNPAVKSESKVKTWMQENNQAQIKKLMVDYLAIAKEHNLKSNINAEQWFNLTYNFPDFIKYEIIGRTSSKDDPNSYSGNAMVYAANQTVYKYNVPQNALVSAYWKISKSWEDPIIETGLIYTLLYLAITMAMLIFSFKVSSGRNWLIALISTGVLFIITGILSALSGSGITFLVFWLLAIATFMIHFFITLGKNKGKNISGISLNLMLWSLAGFLPIIYGLVMEFYNNPKTINFGNQIKYENTPQHDWLEENLMLFTWVNILIVIILMFFITQFIKKWKGLAES